MSEEGRGSDELAGKKRVAGAPEVGRIGVVGEVAISESWLSSSVVLVFLDTGVGAGLSTWEIGRMWGAEEGGAGAVVRARMADSRCWTAWG